MKVADDDSPLTAAAACRWLGVGAVLLSGAIYLLQGVQHVGVDVRNWVYLALMGALGAGGVFSRLAMGDAKGARLFFGLAVALIPLQFSQIAGMVHELVAGPQAAPIGALFDYTGVSPGVVYIVTAVSVAIAVPIAYMGFSVLARAHARTLTATLVALCAAMLIPARASPAGFAVLAALALTALVLERRWFAQHVVFRTLEGRAVRAMLLLPVAISAGRAAFHVDSITGYCAFAAVLALFIVRVAAVWLPPGRWRNGLQDVAVMVAAGSWLVFVMEVLGELRDGWVVALAMLPIAALLLDVSRLRPAGGRAYRVLASLLVLVTALSLTVDVHSIPAAIAVLVSGAALTAWGVVRRERDPALGGAIAFAAGVLTLLVRAVHALDVTAWVSLALLGVAFVLGSSVLERYGRRLTIASRDVYAEIREWR